MLFQIILLICILLGILIIGSTQKETLVSKKIEVSDESYENIYDKLVYDKIKNKSEIDFLKPLLNNTSIVLDAGAGTGHHVDLLTKTGASAIGVDINENMVALARHRYPHDYHHGNLLSMSLFPSQSFTHILCLYFTIYSFQYKEQFFQNVHHWLMPNGYFILHVSKEWNYGPTSKITGNLSYKSTLVHNQHREIVTYKKKQIRRQSKIYMESVDSIVALALQCGFRVHSMYKYAVPYQNQYLYVFTVH